MPYNLDQDPTAISDDNMQHIWPIEMQKKWFKGHENDMDNARKLFKRLYGYEPSV